jgi:hypothetical protein
MEPITDDNPRPVGRYLLLECVGAGGMGAVYRAHDPALDRTVAVKLPLFTGTPEERARRVQRFEREARAAARVQHPHVCPIYDVGEHDGQPFVVMAYLDGPSLAERLRPGRFEDVGAAVKVVEQILGALAAVHAHGIVHRDLKPGNILFDSAGRPLLTDFGLARPEEAEPLTSEGAVVGTPSYMAPEQAAGQGDYVGSWTDLYSLGVVLYQMVTGRLPFEGPPLALLYRIVHEEPPPPTRFRPDLDPALEAVILRALRKKPNERFRNAAEFAAALDRSPPTPAPTPAPTGPASPAGAAPVLPRTKPRRWTLDRALAWGFSGLLIAVIAGSLALLVYVHARPGRYLDWPGVLAAGAILALLLTYPVTKAWAWIEALHTPEGLFYFVRQGWASRVRKALDNGVSPNVRNDLGETPLLLAAAHGHAVMVKVLLLYGADPTAADRLGQTPLAAARGKGHADIADLLAHHGGAAGALAPDLPPPWRPNARYWFPACAALGASLVTIVLFFSTRQATAAVVRLNPSFLGRSIDPWPGNWVILPMLAVPVAVLTLPLLPLLWSRTRFPWLTLAPQRGAVHGSFYSARR